MKHTDVKFLRNALKVITLMSVASAFAIAVPQHAHYLLVVIALVLVLAGLGLRLRYKEQNNWVEHSATILFIEERDELITESQYSKTKYFYPFIKYAYLLNGKSYSGSTVSFERENIWVAETNSWGDSVNADDKWWSSLSVDSTLPVYINPKNPDEAVLIIEMSKHRGSHSLALIAGGILVGFLWFWLAYMGLTN